MPTISRNTSLIKARKVFIPFEVEPNNNSINGYWGLIYVNTEEQVVQFVDPTKRYDNNLEIFSIINADTDDDELVEERVGLDLSIICRVLTPFLRYLFLDIDSTNWKFEFFPSTIINQQTIFPPLTNHNDSGIYILLVIYLLSADIPLYFNESDLLPFKKNVVLWVKKGRIPYFTSE